MHFIIDGQPRSFISLKDFRAEQHLPPDFTVSLFEPKDYTGLGSIERAGAELNSVRQALLNAVPPRITQEALLTTLLPHLERLFENQLYAINPQVGLKDAEIGFAVSGLADVCRAWCYALIRARIDRAAAPDFQRVYAQWLNGSIRVSQTRHRYQTWQIQVLTHAYGRFGLVIHADETDYYVYDPSLACPAEGYMMNLLYDVINSITEHIA
ncbi:MAG: hypothetical protein U0694_18420 [Anaerolineae bacterium]